MSRAEEYDKKADELEAAAQGKPLGGERDDYLKLAAHWRKLAEDARRAAKRGL